MTENPIESSEIAGIKAVNRLRDKAFEAKDIWEYINYFTDDAVWMPYWDKAIEGKKAIRAWATRFDGQAFRFEIIPQQVVFAGNWACDRFIEIMAPVSPSGENGEPRTFQCFWTLRRQEDNSWKIVHWIWNEHPPV